MSDLPAGTTEASAQFRAYLPIWRAVGKGIAIGVLVGVVIVVLPIAADIGIPAPLAIGLPAVIGALLQLLRATFHQMIPLEQAFEYLPTDSAPASLYRLRQTERRLASSSADVEKFDWSLRPMLAQLAVDRLRYKHAIIVRREPERAREMLGEQLWQLMSGPPPNARASAPTREQLAALIAAIEAL